MGYKFFESWNINEVCNFLNYINLGKYNDIFINNNITGKKLKLINGDILLKWGFDTNEMFMLLDSIKILTKYNGKNSLKKIKAKKYHIKWSKENKCSHNFSCSYNVKKEHYKFIH
jgi:hypothetical protein